MINDDIDHHLVNHDRVIQYQVNGYLVNISHLEVSHVIQ